MKKTPSQKDQKIKKWYKTKRKFKKIEDDVDKSYADESEEESEDEEPTISTCCLKLLATSRLQWLRGRSCQIMGPGSARTTNKTVRVPQNFSLKAPGPRYTCEPVKAVKPTKFATPAGRRVRQAIIPGQKNPTCCVSLSSFYNDTFVPCPTCSCGYKNNGTKAGSCVDSQILCAQLEFLGM
ncbi:putative delta(3,5)-Delta(2,4)-dienoyl-CoA isomerase, mitochondrial-like isoform X1 [Capsicum annuum]|nr:putative delta(3,5)-Delta(2,4)-dienoyl-CoA isomerase, mitochondrial-like isoform X1 [Capsicum annuum]KAF3655391.1 putative delta(3,5)-Delta(2,4)-dienoyl-CoA isomerase, mitochondrial-like isoform X1 [Capsicum annuum]